jgi:hypothetical protein
VEKTAKWYIDIEQAELEEVNRYASMTPLERLQILFSLINPTPDDPNSPRLERVARFVDLGEG